MSSRPLLPAVALMLLLTACVADKFSRVGARPTPAFPVTWDGVDGRMSDLPDEKLQQLDLVARQIGDGQPTCADRDECGAGWSKASIVESADKFALALRIRGLASLPLPRPTPPPAPVVAAPVVAPPVVAATAPVPAPIRRSEGGVLAVLPMDVSNAKMEPATRQALEEAVRTTMGEALADYGYTVLTGETTLSYLSDNGVDAEKVCAASCALTAARELKARLFVSGSVANTEGEIVAFVRLFDSATGRQLASVQMTGETVKAVRKEFQSKAGQFVQSALQRMGQ